MQQRSVQNECVQPVKENQKLKTACWKMAIMYNVAQISFSIAYFAKVTCDIVFILRFFHHSALSVFLDVEKGNCDVSLMYKNICDPTVLFEKAQSTTDATFSKESFFASATVPGTNHATC